MTGTVLRGRVLTFVDEPKGADDSSSYRYYEDGAVFINDGKIVAVTGAGHGFGRESALK